MTRAALAALVLALASAARAQSGGSLQEQLDEMKAQIAAQQRLIEHQAEELAALRSDVFDWQRIDVSRLNPAGPGNLTPFGAAPATPPTGVQIGQNLDVWEIRTQFGF